MNKVLITDLLDPSLGSEFQIALKAIVALTVSKDCTVEVWTLERGNNRNTISTWLSNKSLSKRVTIHLVPMRFSKSNGDHSTRLHFLIDLFRLYFVSLRSTDKCSTVWKSGQVNALFYLPFLFLRRPIVIGSISGFEYPPIFSIYKYSSKKLFAKYAAYVLLICLLRVVFKLALRFRRHGTTLLFATQTDRRIFAKLIQSRPQYLSEGLFTEVDLEGILENVPPPKFVGIESECTRLLWAGALIDRKNPLAALSAFSEFRKIVPNSVCLMVGGGPLEADLNNLISLQNDDGISHCRGMKRVDFLKTLGDFHAVLVTSWREANSVFVFEVLASGCPIVSSDVSGMSTSVVENGILVNVADISNSAAVAEALKDVSMRKDRRNIREYVERLHVAETKLIQEILFEK